MSRGHRLLDSIIPNTTCSGPTTAAVFPSRLPQPSSITVDTLQLMAKHACAKSSVVQRLNVTLLDKRLAPMTADTTPLRIQPHCRGEPLLYAASGIALVPFGPGLKHCRDGAVCWFALADCGGSAGSSLDGLMIRTRLVSDRAIFTPHSAFLPLAAGGVLLHWYCPTRAAGDFTLDARLMWFGTDASRIRRDGPDGQRLLDEDQHAWAGLRPKPARGVVRPALTRSPLPRFVGRGGKHVGSGKHSGGQYGLHSQLPLQRHVLAQHRSVTSPAARRSGQVRRRLQQHETSVANPINVFLGGREPRCPRGSACKLDFGTPAYKDISKRCDGESALGGASAAPIVIRVTETKANASASARAITAPKCPPGAIELDGYWIDSAAPLAPAAFAPTPLPAEERSHGRWTWASRGCTRTHLTRAAALRCLADRGRLRVHLHGDSQSRDVYVALAQFLGLPVLDDKQMKLRTNVQGIRRHGTGGEGGGVGVTQGYTWGSLLHPELLATEVADIEPHVVVTNFALAHSSYPVPVLAVHMSKWVEHWQRQFVPHTSRQPPPVLIYQRAGAFEAARGYGPHGLQAQDEHIFRALQPLGFVALETLVPHASRFDATDDGAHVRVNGSVMLNIVSRLLELSCA